MKRFEQLQKILEDETKQKQLALKESFNQDTENFEQKILHGMRNNETYVGLGTFDKDYAEFTKNELNLLGYKNVKVEQQRDSTPAKFNVIVYLKNETSFRTNHPLSPRTK